MVTPVVVMSANLVAVTTPSQEVNPGDLAGPHEVAAFLGVSRQRVYQLSQRPDFPDPVANLAIGKVWRLEDVSAWDRWRKQ